MSEQRRIKVTYEIVTQESAAEADAAERGYIDPEGSIMFGPASAAEFLRENGATEPSSSPFSSGTWYSWADSRVDHATGAEETRSYHLVGFTDEEEREIYDAVRAGRVPAESAAEARRRVESDYKVENGVIRSPGRFESEPSYVVWLSEDIGDRITDEDGNEIEGHAVDEAMRAAFPELGAAEMVAIWTDEQGFHHHRLLSGSQWQALQQDSGLEP